MSAYSQLGLDKKDGIEVLLLDTYGKALSFLNDGIIEQDDSGISFVASKPCPPRDVAIPIKAHLVPEWFFPDDDGRFTIGTDDRQTFESRFVTRNAVTGLHFTRGSAPIQQYFRKRLQVDKGGYISKHDFLRYGKASFFLFRLDDGVYFLDFGPDVETTQENLASHASRTVLLETRSPQYAARRAHREALQQGLPFYPGRLDTSEQLPDLNYNLGQMVVVRRQKTAQGDMFLVTIEKTHV